MQNKRFLMIGFCEQLFKFDSIFNAKVYFLVCLWLDKIHVLGS